MKVSDFSPTPPSQENRGGSRIAIYVCPKPLEPAASPCRKNSHLGDCFGRSSLNPFSLRGWKGFTSVLGGNFHDTDYRNFKISAVHTFLLEG